MSASEKHPVHGKSQRPFESKDTGAKSKEGEFARMSLEMDSLKVSSSKTNDGPMDDVEEGETRVRNSSPIPPQTVDYQIEDFEEGELPIKETLDVKKLLSNGNSPRRKEKTPKQIAKGRTSGSQSISMSSNSSQLSIPDFIGSSSLARVAREPLEQIRAAAFQEEAMDEEVDGAWKASENDPRIHGKPERELFRKYADVAPAPVKKLETFVETEDQKMKNLRFFEEQEKLDRMMFFSKKKSLEMDSVISSFDAVKLAAQGATVSEIEGTKNTLDPFEEEERKEREAFRKKMSASLKTASYGEDAKNSSAFDTLGPLGETIQPKSGLGTGNSKEGGNDPFEDQWNNPETAYQDPGLSGGVWGDSLGTAEAQSGFGQKEAAWGGNEAAGFPERNQDLRKSGFEVNEGRAGRTRGGDKRGGGSFEREKDTFRGGSFKGAGDSWDKVPDPKGNQESMGAWDQKPEGLGRNNPDSRKPNDPWSKPEEAAEEAKSSGGWDAPQEPSNAGGWGEIPANQEKPNNDQKKPQNDSTNQKEPGAAWDKQETQNNPKEEKKKETSVSLWDAEQPMGNPEGTNSAWGGDSSAPMAEADNKPGSAWDPGAPAPATREWGAELSAPAVQNQGNGAGGDWGGNGGNEANLSINNERPFNQSQDRNSGGFNDRGGNRRGGFKGERNDGFGGGGNFNRDFGGGGFNRDFGGGGFNRDFGGGGGGNFNRDFGGGGFNRDRDNGGRFGNRDGQFGDRDGRGGGRSFADRDDGSKWGDRNGERRQFRPRNDEGGERNWRNRDGGGDRGFRRGGDRDDFGGGPGGDKRFNGGDTNPEIGGNRPWGPPGGNETPRKPREFGSSRGDSNGGGWAQPSLVSTNEPSQWAQPALISEPTKQNPPNYPKKPPIQNEQSNSKATQTIVSTAVDPRKQTTIDSSSSLTKRNSSGLLPSSFLILKPNELSLLLKAHDMMISSLSKTTLLNDLSENRIFPILLTPQQRNPKNSEDLKPMGNEDPFSSEEFNKMEKENKMKQMGSGRASLGEKIALKQIEKASLIRQLQEKREQIDSISLSSFSFREEFLPRLVLDLGETLMHGCEAKSGEEIQEIEEVSSIIRLKDSKKDFRVIRRPFVQEFLERLRSKFVIVVYTLGVQEFIQKSLDCLDETRQCIRRNKCYYPKKEERANFVKELAKMGYPKSEKTSVCFEDSLPIWGSASAGNVIPSKKFIPIKNPANFAKYSKFSFSKEDVLDDEFLQYYEEKITCSKRNSQLLNLVPALERLSDKFMRRRLLFPNEDQHWDIRKLLREEYSEVLSNVSLFILTKNESLREVCYNLASKLGGNLTGDMRVSDLIILDPDSFGVGDISRDFAYKAVSLGWLMDCYLSINRLSCDEYKLSGAKGMVLESFKSNK